MRFVKVLFDIHFKISLYMLSKSVFDSLVSGLVCAVYMLIGLITYLYILTLAAVLGCLFFQIVSLRQDGIFLVLLVWSNTYSSVLYS